MASLNRVQLIGNLGSDPEVKFTNNSTVANFTVATSENWTDKNGEKQSKTDWHRVNVWGKLAELCGEYLHKGSQIYLEGSIHTREYEKDGGKRYVTEIKAFKIQFLDKKPQTQNSRSNGYDNAPREQQSQGQRGYGQQQQGNESRSGYDTQANEETPF